MSYIHQPSRKELIEQVKRHAPHVHGRVLDVGAGKYDRYSDLFTYSEYVRMDQPGTPHIHVAGSADAIAFPDASFDSIVCTQVIGDVYDLPQAFREFARVLRPDGTLLLTEALFDTLHDEPYDYWRLTPHALRKLAEGAGLEVVVLEQRGGYYSTMAQMRLRYLIERYDIYHKWYRRFFSGYARLLTNWALACDRRDTSKANRLYAHRWLLIARKP